MGIFDFLKREIKTEDIPTAPPIIEGKILLVDDYTVHWTSVINELRDVWGCTVGEPLGIQEFTWFVEVDGYRIGIALHSTTPVPQEELQEVAPYNYFWANAAEETTHHRVHIAVCIMHTGKNPMVENLIFTKVVASILRHTVSIGFYMPSRRLLISKEFYLNYTNTITEGHLPLFNWIYFGSITNHLNESRSFYTIGLKDFNKKEIEIVDSIQSSSELSKVLVDTVEYILLNDAVLVDGQFVELSEGHTLQIHVSKGVHLHGETIQLVC